jgi:hypothetical protein
VAQLVEATDSRSGGCEFESRRWYSFLSVIRDLRQSPLWTTLTTRFGARIIHIVPMLIATRLEPTDPCASLRRGQVRSVDDQMVVQYRCVLATQGSQRKQADPRRDPNS